jgi:hypothetical protein
MFSSTVRFGKRSGSCNDRDARVSGVRGVVEEHSAAVDDQHALVGRVDAGEDLHQRRLPGPVLSDEGVRLAGVQVERNVLERPNGAKGLRRMLQRQHQSGFGHAASRRHASTSVSSRLDEVTAAKRARASNQSALSSGSYVLI